MSITGVEEDFLQILDEGGQALGSETSVKIQALYKEDEGSRYELLLSSKACVRLPKKNGTLLVTLPANRKALVHRHEQSGGQLLRKKLVSAPSFQTAFPCGEGGLFANENLAHNWNFESSDNLQSMKLEILARDAQRQTSYPLFVKDFGETAVNLQPTLDTSELNEGIYQLEVNAYDLLDSFGEVSRPLIKNANCSLTILRRPPLVGGSFLQNELPVFEPGKALPWLIEQPNSQLYVCFEERSGLASPSLLAPTSCEAQSKCNKLESFKPVNAISSDTVGLFDVFAFARDRAGNDSPVRCQTVAFSSAPPALSLKWERESWNQDGAFMRELDAFIRAKASIGTHEVLAEETLKQTLECKVEFILQGKDTLSGKDVICTQGRCRGKSLSKFIPCDPEIEFTLQEAWQQPAIQQSMLRLVVRAQDGAGHVSEVARSIWINNRSWDVQKLEYRQDGKPADARQLIQDASGQFLTVFGDGNTGGSVRKWDGGAWVDVTPELPGRYQNAWLFITPEQELYASFSRWTSEDVTFRVLARWDGKGFHPIAMPDALAESCSPLTIAKSGFYCRTNDYLYHFDGKNWGEKIPLPNMQFEIPDCYGITLNTGGRVWQVCGDEFYIWSSGPRWQPLPKIEQRRGLSVSSAFSDSVGRVWVFMGFAQAQDIVFGYFNEHDSFQLVSLPKEKSGYLNPCMPTLAHDGRVVCERYVLNTTTLDWQLLPEFAQLDYKTFASLSPGQEGSVSFTPILGPGSPIQMWAAPADGFYISSSAGLEHWPSTMTQAYLNIRSTIYRDKDGSLWLNASAGRNGVSMIHRIKAQPVVTYDQNILGLSHGILPVPWEDAAGNVKMAFYDHGIFAFKEGVWQQESPGLPTGSQHFINFEASDGTLYAATGSEIWMRPRDAKTFTLLTSGIITAPSVFEEAADGSVWFYTNMYLRQVNRIANGKLTTHDLPVDDAADMSGILTYKGRIIFVTKTSFYWADSGVDGRVVFTRFDPEIIGLGNLPQGIARGVQKISRTRYLFTVSQDYLNSNYFIGDSQGGSWERFIPPHSPLFLLTTNEAGDMFGWFGDGSIRKKTSSGDWTTVLTVEQIQTFGSQNSYLNWIKVDHLGRLWIHTGGPWLIARLDE
jgi:hypothetical protein